MTDGLATISLWQPWATLIAIGTKTIETRHWNTRYRGPLAIHAAQRRPKSEYIGDYWVYDHGNGYRFDLSGPRTDPAPNAIDPAHALPLGAIVATCTLADVVPTESLVPCIDVGNRGWGIQAIGRVPLIDPDQCPYGDYSPGRFAWLLDDVKPIDPPIPAKGRQGLWRWNRPSPSGVR